MNIESHLKKLKHLKKGWFCKDSGEPIKEEIINLLLKGIKTDRNCFFALRKALIIPNLDGTLDIEWHCDSASTYLSIDSISEVSYQEFDHTDGQEYFEKMNLKDPNTWKKVWDRVEFNLSLVE